MRKWLKDLRGERVAFTGGAWIPRLELFREVRRKGGISSTVTAATVLVKGTSLTWKYGDHGIKERQAAKLVRHGTSISLVHESEFRKLVEGGKPARVADRIAGEPVEWLEQVTKRKFEQAANIKGPLDREHTALGRVEQGYLRGELFDGGDQATCSLCRRRLPIELLVAAHVKQRKVCSRRERLDVPNVVFGVCLLGCDALYERGLVAVDERGYILSSTVQSSPDLRAVIRRFQKKKCKAWNEARAKYFNWHLTSRFQGTMTIV